MELITMEMTEIAKRSRSALVHHSDLALDRGLEPLERIVIQDDLSGEYYAATVAEVQFELEDTDYRLEIGVRLPMDLALDRLTGLPGATQLMGTQRVADLLAQLRGVRVPAPRSAADAQVR